MEGNVVYHNKVKEGCQIFQHVDNQYTWRKMNCTMEGDKRIGRSK